MRRSDVRVGDLIEGGGQPVAVLKWTDVDHPPERGQMMTGGNVPAFMKRSAAPTPPISYGAPLSTAREIEARQEAIRLQLAELQRILKRP